MNRRSTPEADAQRAIVSALRFALPRDAIVHHCANEVTEAGPRGEEGFGFGLEYVLLQRAMLGCKVDGGQHKMGSYTHPDAEVIAATVAGIPDSLGGIRMAIQVAELARAGLTPDWMPGAVPRCVPLEIKNNQHGERATTIVVGTERVKTRGKWRTVELLACPVTWRPHPEQIASARRGYEDWWLALGWVRDGLAAGGMLREIEVTVAMPKAKPWILTQLGAIRR